VLDPEKVIVRMDRGDNVSTLEVDIEVPMFAERKSNAALGTGYGSTRTGAP
jgi:cell division topological specificity factor